MQVEHFALASLHWLVLLVMLQPFLVLRAETMLQLRAHRMATQEWTRLLQSGE